MISRFLKKLFGPRYKARSKELHALENVLGYRFQNPELLKTALAHRSFVNSRKNEKIESYERLEFLGDSILNMIVTDFLYHRHPTKKEGRLSKMKSLIVSAKVLDICARNWNLGHYILLSHSEAKSGGRERMSILADAYESILGAVYLDGGLEPARRLVETSLIKIVDEVLADEELVNYKSRLLEYTQSLSYGAPEYHVIEESGPEHRKRFVISARVRDQEWGRGVGHSKKSSEQAAARDALDRRQDSEDSSSD